MKMNLTLMEKSYILLQNQLQARSLGRTVLETLLHATVFAAVLVGNAMVLFIVYRKRSSGKISYFLIGSLAFSDILLPMLTGWQAVASLSLGYWPFGDDICQYHGYFVGVLVCASLLIMTIIAVNRYFRVVRPNQYRSMFTPKRTKCYILAAWVLAFVEPISYLASGERYSFNPGKYICFQDPSKITASGLLLYVYGIIPMPIISVCYYRIFMTIKVHQQRMNNIQSGSNSLPAPNIGDIIATRMLFITLVGFLCCWMPVALIDIIDLCRAASALPREVYVMFTFLGSISACINPLIYGIMNRMFRNEYKEIFKLKCFSKNRVEHIGEDGTRQRRPTHGVNIN